MIAGVTKMSPNGIALEAQNGATSLRNPEVINLLSHWESLRGGWDEFVADHPKGSVFHTSEMIRVFQSAKRHSVLPLAALDGDGRIIALLVAVRVQTLPDPIGRFSSRSIMYAEPLCRDSQAGAEALAKLIARHDAETQRRVLFTEVRPLEAPGVERTALEDHGYEYLEYLNYVVDVTQSPDLLWTDLHKSARRKIRQCERRGIEIREVPTATGVNELYGLLQLSFAHAQVPLADRSLFEAAAAVLGPRGMVRLFAAYDADTPRAMDLLLIYKKRVYVWYGGLARMPGVSPCAILRWHELRWAHENGFAIYDTGGAGWPNVAYGVRDYKSIFGGQLVKYGRYRKVHSRWKMALAERAYEWRRAKLFSNSTSK
jgi:serine/alanine adding enzyme